MSDIITLLIESAELLNEGAVKSSKKHKLDNYLKKYGYQGDKNEGTIKVDGKEYKIDRKNSHTMDVDAGPLGKGTVPRQTSTDSLASEPKIHLDKNFEKIKNNKRRDAILQHEIGHLKNHSLASSSNTKEGRDAVLDSMSKSQSIVNSGTSDYKKQFKDELEKSIPDKSKESSTKKELARKENLEKFKKHENEGQHADRSEYEADAYASQHKNGEHLKRGVREYYKKANSDKGIKNQIKGLEKTIGSKLELTKEEKDEIKKKQNISAQNDMNQRTKASKDKSINKSVYRESAEMYNMISETLEFLD